VISGGAAEGGDAAADADEGDEGGGGGGGGGEGGEEDAPPLFCAETFSPRGALQIHGGELRCMRWPASGGAPTVAWGVRLVDLLLLQRRGATLRLLALADPAAAGGGGGATVEREVAAANEDAAALLHEMLRFASLNARGVVSEPAPLSPQLRTTLLAPPPT
jgi:hypothetical protein